MAEETLLVDDREVLVAIWLVRSSIFGLDVRTPLTARWTGENDPLSVGRRGGVLHCA